MEEIFGGIGEETLGDPFSDRTFRRLSVGDQVAVLKRLDRMVGDPRFASFSPQDQWTLLEEKYPSLRETGEEYKRALMEALPHTYAPTPDEQIPPTPTTYTHRHPFTTPDPGSPEGLGVGPPVPQPPLWKTLGEIGMGILQTLGIPQEYVLGALSGRPGERVRTEELFPPKEGTLVSPEDLPNIFGPFRGLISSYINAPRPDVGDLVGIATDPLAWVGVGALRRPLSLLGKKVPPVEGVGVGEVGVGEVEATIPPVEAPGVPSVPPESILGKPGDIQTLAELERQRWYGVDPSTLGDIDPLSRPPQYVTGGPSEFITQPSAVKEYPSPSSVQAPGEALRQPREGPPTGVPPSPSELSKLYKEQQGKPSFLKTAEEMVYEKAPLPTAEDLLRRRLESQAGLTAEATLSPEARMGRVKAYRDFIEERRAHERAVLEKLRSPGITGVGTPRDPEVPPAIKNIVHDYEEGGTTTPNLVDDTRILPSKGGKTTSLEPGWIARFFLPALDNLRRVGEAGTPLREKGEKLSTILGGYINRWERMASDGFMTLDDDLARIWGRSSPGRGTHKGNVFKTTTMDSLYNITPEEVQQLVDYMYTEGRMLPKGKNAHKIIETGEAFKKFSALVGKHPSLPLLEGVRTPTGEFKPFGMHDLFMPQQPTSAARRKFLGSRYVEELWRQARKEGYTGTVDDYRDFIRRYHALHREGDIESARFAGLENSRLFDASKVGLPHEVLADLGYETDPLRAMFRYVTGGLRRLEGKAIEGEVSALVNEIQSDIRSLSHGAQDGMYVREVANATLNRDYADYVDTPLKSFVHNMRGFNDITLLQLAGLDQFNQLIYGVGRAGLKNTILGIRDYYRSGGKVGDATVERTGALFTQLMNDLTNPQTVGGQLASGFLRGQGFTKADSWVRAVTSVIGSRHVREVVDYLRAYPTDKRLIRIMEEGLGFTPEERKAITLNGLTHDQEMRAIQKFVNDTSGTRDVRSLALWLTSKDLIIELIKQYKNFAFGNAGELARQLRVYGPWAVTRTVAGAMTMGEVTRDLHYMLTHLEATPFRGPEAEKRIVKPLRQLHKYSPMAARMIDDTIFGLGSIYTMLAYTALDGERTKLYELIVGPSIATGAELVSDVARGVTKLEEGKPYPFRDLALDVGRRTPVVGPAVPSILKKHMPLGGLTIPPVRGVREFE